MSAGALGAAPVAERKAALQDQRGELRQRLENLRQELASAEENRADAAGQLRTTEAAISQANRRLHRLTEQRAAVEAEAAELGRQGRRLEDQSRTQQDQLSRLLYRNYTRGQGDALEVLISGRDPNQAALDYHFLTLLTRAKAELIADLRTRAAERKELAAAAQEKQAELAAIEREQQEARQALLAQQREKQRLMARLADRIKGQRRELGALQRDEKRLAKLIDALTRIVRRPPPARPQAAPAPARPAPRVPDPVTADGAFAALKGRLPLPVRGEVASQFGKPRPEGGTTWKGLFIRAAEGAEVRAVAAGQVVYADWLRGFGNLLVLDHGDGFLSVYGNNQSLVRETGEQVTAGAVVATVGNTGGNPESGLYFELRHQGQAFDPLRWVSLR